MSITITGDVQCFATNVVYRLDTPPARAFLGWKKKSFTVLSRVDDPTDLEYVRQGGILQQVLRERIAAN